MYKVSYSSSTTLKCRKNIRLAPQNYVGRGIYFVTICCHNRQTYFAEVSFARVVLGCLVSLAKRHSFVLYAYCAMPDHLHFLARGGAGSSDLLAFVTAFKQRTTRMQKMRSAAPLWHAKFYDHILRDADGIEAVAHYIWANPVRKGCPDAASYALSGSQTIDWKARTAASWMWYPPWKGRPGSARERREQAPETGAPPGPTRRR